ncbi:hypothetical protein FGW20_09375 [Methanoculleus sp. FWC-SCC3]|uniref:Nitrogen regulatory protein P-II n=1 Tax=Methanoculleus methanifontis TaxID=2584086 RepID=A0ABT8M460_9EURY|nr:hypothetical protein [Methanoculleus sp. FWC-SCC3]MDN7013248.1 hypothetical protein [Methanoculleus sp. FWC-SCC3]
MLDETSAGGPLVVMITIFDRELDETIMNLFKGESGTFNLLTRGRGTADSRIMSYLGLGETEKTILISTMPPESSNSLLAKIRDELRLERPGRGIAFTVPMGSVCGARTVDYLRGSSRGGEGRRSMELSMRHDLVIAVANQGFSDVVMEAAKSANATGGTIIPARGIDFENMEEFFGAPILPEKDLILILTGSESKCGIMEAIATRAGPHTDAGAIVFSLPVNGVAGVPPE